jgi:hypothetical protein
MALSMAGSAQHTCSRLLVAVELVVPGHRHSPRRLDGLDEVLLDCCVAHLRSSALLWRGLKRPPVLTAFDGECPIVEARQPASQPASLVLLYATDNF